MADIEISIETFQFLCQRGQMYQGKVRGMGYVYWVPKPFDASIAGVPSQTSFNTPQKTKFQALAYEMMVLKDKPKTGLRKAGEAIETGNTALSVFDFYLGLRSSSTAPVVLGPEYIQVNRQGTIVRNLQRVYTTKGDIASKVSDKIFWVGTVMEVALFLTGKNSWEETRTSLIINTGIFVIGKICPQAGLVLGTTWLMLNLCKNDPKPSLGSYEEIHGTITPADNLRITKPYIRLW